jgi:hypothetical protein
MAYAQARQSVDHGTPRVVYHPLLIMMGWTRVSTDKPTRLKDIPSGRVICRLEKHLVAVIDKVPHDTHNAMRDRKYDILSYYLPPADPYDMI